VADIPVEVSGPFFSGEKSLWVAWMVEGEYREQRSTVCLVCRRQPDDMEFTRNSFPQLFQACMNYISQAVRDWRAIRCYVAVLLPQETDEDPTGEPTQRSLRFETYDGNETAPEAIALDVLKNMWFQFSRTVDGITYHITERETDPNTGDKMWNIGREGGETTFPMFGKELRDEYLQMIPVTDEYQARMYLSEALNQYKTAPREAFRSYYYFLLLGEKVLAEVPEGAIELGLELTHSLLEHGLIDYANWVGQHVAALAEKHNQPDKMVAALREAAIASQSMGHIRETMTAYERSIALLDTVSDPLLKAQLLMSYGVSALVLYNHWEAQSQHSEAEQAALAAVLDAIQPRFKQARELYDPAPDQRRLFSQSAIDLDLARIADLRGQHQEALDALAKIRERQICQTDTRLRTTVWAYQAAIWKKIAQKDPSKHPMFVATLRGAMEALRQIPNAPLDRVLFLNMLVGDENLRQGGAAEAVPFLLRAYSIQRMLGESEIRPATPGSAYGGVVTIDLCGKLQHALVSQPPRSDGTDPAWDAFLLADYAKGHFFKRDLILSLDRSDANLPPYLAAHGAGLRSALLGNTADYRILLADYEWYLEHEVGLDKAAVESSRQEHPLTAEEAQGILGKSGTSTVLLSLYATYDTTFLYLLTSASKAPIVMTLDAGLPQLAKISAGVQTGIGGDDLYPGIDVRAPERRQKFFVPFLNMAETLEPVIEQLKGFERILISPHGVWHNLPLHALILPALWEAGEDPGIGYLPTLRLLDLLEKREEVEGPMHLRAAALTTAPSDQDPIAVFEAAHNDLATTFARLKVPSHRTFGADSTVANFFGGTRESGLHHVLAHGRFERTDDPMRSSILLSDGTALPPKDQTAGDGPGHGVLLPASAMMACGTSARHISMQACSLGRSLPGIGDEFWGVARALIAAGAESVLAPLWDIDIESSTRISVLFYENWLGKGMPKWKALAAAQRQMASGDEHPAWRHFYHWAAFQLVGA
jgi:hypothetical protein